jgi:galactokinase
MNVKQAIHMIEQGALNARLCALYGEDALERVRARYVAAITAFAERFGTSRDIALFSVPGRTELSGNHTDHNRGRVIAAAVDADVIAVASPTANRTVRLHSEGFPADEVALDAFLLPDATRFGCSDALIAGVADGFRTRGWQIGGFDAYTTSNVPKGSGLSSSAAFENTVGSVLNHFYNNGKVPPAELAVISQYAENRFFGKIIGLLGGVSTSVYVTHLVVYDIYCTYLGWRLESLSVRKQEFIATVFVVSVTLIGCFVWQILWNGVKKLRKS